MLVVGETIFDFPQITQCIRGCQSVSSLHPGTTGHRASIASVVATRSTCMQSQFLRKPFRKLQGQLSVSEQAELLSSSVGIASTLRRKATPTLQVSSRYLQALRHTAASYQALFVASEAGATSDTQLRLARQTVSHQVQESLWNFSYVQDYCYRHGGPIRRGSRCCASGGPHQHLGLESVADLSRGV